MRVTKNKLRDIIREALEDNNPQKAIEKLEDIELVEPESADDELEHHVDYSKIMTGESSIDHPETLDLIVKEVNRRISEKKDQNKDGENDFDDVKIALHDFMNINVDTSMYTCIYLYIDMFKIMKVFYTDK